jgi:hypothetical protein
MGKYEGGDATDFEQIMNALVINCSKPHYNLGAHKLADWLRSQGCAVEINGGDPGLFTLGYDQVYLSVIFSWHAPIARAIALRVKGDSDVWCGGPGMAALGNWWKRETGLDAVIGLDQRFERQRGDYKMCFASRGCPVNCWFCVVPKIEGRAFTLDYDFQPAPILCDNNLSALPVEFQMYIINRYRESGIKLCDANSGFEPRSFDEDCFERWRSIVPVWRFAFDEMSEADEVNRMMKILGDVRSRRKQVYVLAGNEPIEACYERALKVIEWGGEPYCQPVTALNALTKTPMVRHDWTLDKLRDFCRYFNRRLWRSIKLSEYQSRQYEPAPFKEMR